MEKYQGILPVYPEGWYVISFSDELKIGDVKPITFCGKELVLFRTKNGDASLINAYCGHMGAHMGYGGKVEGENLRCPFHGFCFNGEGECTSTSYGTPPSPRVKISNTPVKEFNGIIMAYFHPKGEAPEWDIPAIDTEDWSDMLHITWKMKSHPQETAENAVDVGHFAEVHNYEEVKELVPFNTNGAFMNARYAMTRPSSFLKKYLNPIKAEFEIYKYGFGYSCVETHTQNFDMNTRHFVFTQPINGEEIYLRIAVSMKKVKSLAKVNPFLAILPRKIAEKLILKTTFKAYKNDVSQDFDIWQNKIYVHPPALSKGDGPVMQYRKWAEQFYKNIDN